MKAIHKGKFLGRSSWTGGLMEHGPVTQMTSEEYSEALVSEGTHPGGVSSKPVLEALPTHVGPEAFAVALINCDKALRKLSLGQLIDSREDVIEPTLFDKAEGLAGKKKKMPRELEAYDA